MTFDAPIPLGLPRGNIPASGLSSKLSGPVYVTVAGINFGGLYLPSSVITAAEVARQRALMLDASSSQAVSWISDSVLMCMAVPGLSKTKQVVVTIGLRLATGSQLLSFDAPLVGQGTGNPTFNFRKTSVSVPILFSVLNLGVSDRSSSSRLLTGSERSLWLSDSSLSCVPSTGAMYSLGIALTAGRTVASFSNLFSYLKPIISYASRQNQAINAFSTISISGVSFGIIDISSSILLGNTVCRSTRWTSDTGCVCTSSSSFSASLSIALTGGLLLKTTSSVYSFDRVKVTGQNGTMNAGKVGGTLVAFSCQNCLPSLVSTSGYTSSYRSEWLSETAVLSKIASGILTTLNFIITSSSAPATETQVISFDEAELSLLPVPNSVTFGNSFVVVAGQNLAGQGYSQRTRVGGSAGETTVWISDTATATLMSSGVASTLDTTFTLALERNSLSIAFSFDEATLKIGAGMQNSNPSLHQSSVIVAFIDSGRFDSSLQMSAGLTRAQSSGWISDSSVIGKLASGLGQSLRLYLTIQVSHGNSRISLASYDAQILSSTIPVNFPSLYVGLIALSVLNMGSIAFSGNVRSAESKCETSQWFSDTSVIAKTALGFRHTRMFVLTTSQAVSTESSTVSYDKSVLQSLSPVNSPVLSNRITATIAVGGLQMLGFLFTLKMHAMITGCESTSWMSETSLVGRIAAGAVSQYAVNLKVNTLTVGELVSSLTAMFSYDENEVSSVFMPNAAVSDSRAIRFFGSNLARVSMSNIARIGLSSCEVTMWESDTTVSGLVSAGLSGGTNGAYITALLSSASVTLAWSYDVPSASTVAFSNMATLSDTATIVVYSEMTSPKGFSYSKSDGSIRCRMEVTSCQKTTWISDSALLSLFATGLYRSRGIFLTIEGSVGSRSTSLSFGIPMSSKILKSNFGSTGSTSLTLLGNGFSLDQSFKARVGSTSGEGTFWNSDSAVILKLSSGKLVSRSALATVGVQVGSISVSLSYDLPVVSIFERSNGIVLGSFPTFILGYGFALHSNTINARGGFTRIAVSTWNSDTALFCQSIRGQQSSSKIIVTIGSLEKSLSCAYSQDLIVIVSEGQGNVATTGAMSLTATGALFGLTIASSHARQHISDCENSLWQSDSSVLCKSAAGLISALLPPARLLLSVGERAGTASSGISMLEARITSTKASNKGIDDARSGFTVSGSDFGSVSFCLVVKFGGTSCEFSMWFSDSAVSVKPAKGHGNSILSLVTVGGLQYTLTEAMSFNNPNYKNQIGDNSLKNRPSTGTSTLTVIGVSFGVSSICPQSAIFLTECESSLWNSDTGVLCKVVPFGARTLRAELTVGVLGASLTDSFSFDIPSVSTTPDGNRRTNVHISIRIAGSEYGNAEHSIKSRGSGTSCEQSLWMSDTEIACVQGSFAHSGASMRLVFTVARKLGSLSDLLSFDVVGFSVDKTRYNYPITGIVMFTVLGLNIGTGSFSALTEMGLTSARSTSWISDSTVFCIIGQGLQKSRSLSLTSGNSIGTATHVFSYSASTSSRITFFNDAGTGTTSISIFGSGFALYKATNKIRFGHSACESSIWTSASSVACRKSQGLGASDVTTITTQLRSNSMTGANSFDAPLLSKRNLVVTWCTLSVFVNCSIGANWSTPCNASKKILSNCTKNATVVCSNVAYNGPNYHAEEAIIGHNFGLARSSVRLRVGVSQTERSEWNSDTSLMFYVAQGLESTRAISMTASMFLATTSEVFSFNKPVVTAVRYAGAQLLTVKVPVSCVDDLQHNNFQSFSPPALLNVTSSSLIFPTLVPNSMEPLRRDNYTFWYAFIQGIPCVFAYISPSLGVSNVSQLEALQLAILYPSSVSKRSLECQLPKSLLLQAVSEVNNSLYGNMSRGTSNVTIFASSVSCSKVSLVSDFAARCDANGLQSIDIPIKCATALQVDLCLSGVSTSNFECTLQDSSTCVSTTPQNVRGVLGGNSPPSSSASSIEAVSGLGMESSSSFARNGLTASPHSLWFSETSMSCLTGVGVDGSLNVIVSAGVSVGSLTQGASFDFSSLKSMKSVVNIPSTGSVSVTALGTALSAFGVSSAVRVYSNTESTIWISDSCAIAKISDGAGARLRIITTVGSRQDGTLSDALSYDSPSTFAVIPSTRPSTGVTTVSIIGSNLAIASLSQKARVGGTPCESARWVSSSTLLCRIAAGAHNMQQVIVTALQQTSDFPPDPQQTGRPKWPPFFFSYLAPVMYHTPSPSGQLAYGSTRGGWTLTIQGTNFGTASDLVRVSLGSNIWPAERIDCRLVRATLCVGCGDAQLSDSFVRCLVPPGDGLSLGLVMEVGDQTDVMVDGFSYSRPVVHSVASWDTCDVLTCGSLSTVGLETSNPSEGLYPPDLKTFRLLVVTGENFGVSDSLQSVSVQTIESSKSPTEVQIGGSDCTNVLVNADGTVLTCSAPVPHVTNTIIDGTVGCQAMELVVSVRNQTSATFSRFGLLYLENMPTLVPTAGSNTLGYAWMDGDGSGMTLQFGMQSGTTGQVWAPLRTNQGRQYMNRPGSRSDDFAYMCSPSPAAFGDTSCGKYLVSQVSTDLWSIIGSNATCSWPSQSILHVRFGFGASLVPSIQPPSLFKVRPGVIMNFGAPSYAIDIDVLVVSPTTERYPPDGSTAQNGGLPSSNAVAPRVFLQSPAFIGPCDNLAVTAVVEFASGCRDTGLTYLWTSVPDLTSITKTATTGAAASTAIVPWNDPELDYGVAYRITLVVENFLSQQSVASVTVIREQIGVPTVVILGGLVRQIRRDQMVVINAAAFLPACLGAGCTCASSSDTAGNRGGWDGTAAVLEFQWSVVGSTSSALQQAVALGTSDILAIPATSLTMLSVGANYTIQVEAGVWTGFANNDINFYSTTAEVSLVPYSVPPVARIRYGNRACSSTDPLVLDGSSSFDPDSLPGQSLKFQWFLDAGAMYDEIPLHLKEQRGLMSPGVVSRKSYVVLLQGSQCTLSQMIVNTNLNDEASIFSTDNPNLNFKSTIIPESDFELFVWGGTPPTTKQAIPWPVTVIIGLYVTDADGSQTYTSVEMNFYDPTTAAQEGMSLEISSTVTFPISIEPLLEMVHIAENDLVLRVRLNDDTMAEVNLSV